MNNALFNNPKAIYAIDCEGITTINANTPLTKMIVLESRVLRKVTKALQKILKNMQE